jgi:DMSO reductase family type II enzyme heme b subunit
MKIKRVKATPEALLDPGASVWNGVSGREFPLAPTPLKGNPAIEHISPFIATSTDHGVITKLTVDGVHNGEVLALRLTWSGEQHAKLVDLDEFVDGVAVMFPLSAKASAVTMGARGEPVNAWYWKANLEEVGFDVVAEGYGTSMRRKGKESQVRAGASYNDGVWRVVLSRALDIGNRHARFRPGKAARLAFAVWDGGNRERAGRKSFSGDFIAAELDA